MKKNTLIYGINKDYYNNYNWIKANYEITGAYDQDESRLPDKIGIRSQDIKDVIGRFDTILVTADPVSIVHDLTNEYHVPIDKIEVLYYELDKQFKGNIHFWGADNDDAVLLLLTEQLGYGHKDVTYLEIGTNDPVRFNNTYNFYKKNTRGGVLVDALSIVGVLAKMSRPKDRFIHAAVSAKSGKDVFFYACKSSEISSLDKNFHHQGDGISYNNTVSKIRVPNLGINNLLEQLGYLPDLLHVDAEGEDENILCAIDYEKYRIPIIMAETLNLDDNGARLHTFMDKKGYSIYTILKKNTIYITKECSKLLKRL